MIRFLAIAAALTNLASPVASADLTPMEALGKTLFFDTDLSVNANQSCASCHDPDMGFSSPHGHFNAEGAVVEGSVPGRFGNRRPPSAAYASPGPVFHHTYEDGDILFVGGAFLDGRATGHALGTVVADQAQGPFLNPVEMGLPHAACVVAKACAADYAGEMKNLWGADICAIALPETLAADCADPDAKIAIEDKDLAGQIDAAYAAIARSIAAYEASDEVNRYASRFDKYLAGEAVLTEQELAGLKLYEGKALCAECHVLDRGPHGEPPLLTDFTFDNLGVPRNPANPWYAQAAFNPDGAAWLDQGLGATLAGDPAYVSYAEGIMGAQKVPTLRNITKAITPDTPRAYMHNGYFRTLEGVVHFYNTRDVLPACAGDLPEAEAMAAKCWPAAEFPQTMNKDELGNLKLTEAEEADLVAFLGTLDDD